MASSSMTMPALVPLAAHTGKPPIPLRRPFLLIGSRNIAHLHLLSRSVSKAHALIINSDGKIYIRDLASRTHVFVNGEQVRQADLKNGDLIKIGSFTFRLTIPPSWETRPRDTKAPPAQLDAEGAEIPVRLDERVTLIGRRPTCDVSLLEDSASTAHAVLFEMGGRRFLRDLGSRTGTFVNGRKIHQQELEFGDVIRIGETDFNYSPASEIATGPVPVDELDPDFDELEDLVGTAPLMEEPPEVIAKRLEREQAQAEAPQVSKPAVPKPPQPTPADASHAPIPLDIDLDTETEDQPELDVVEPRREVPAVPARPESPIDLEPEAAEPDTVEEIPVEEPEPVDETPAVEESDTVESAANIAVDVIATEEEQEEASLDFAAEAPQPAEADDTDDAAVAAAPEVAGIDELDLLDVDAPPTETEIDLTADLDLEAEPTEADPEATHALPNLKFSPPKPPAISDEIVDEPIAPPAEADTEPEIEIEAESDLDDELAPIDLDTESQVEHPTDESSGDTVALAAAQAALDDSVDSADGEDTDELPLDIEPVAEKPVDEQVVEESALDEDEQADQAPAIDEQTLEPTAPTPESAQSLEPELDITVSELSSPDALTDTGFDREVHAFVADSAEPIDEIDDLDEDVETEEPAGDALDLAADDTSEEAPAPVADFPTEVEQQLEADLDLTDEIEDIQPDEASPVTAEIDEEDDFEPDAPVAESPDVDEPDVQEPQARELDTQDTPRPTPAKGDFTHGVNQWGFLGGTPLVLGDLPTPPPPARGGRATPRQPEAVPFGSQPLPVDELAEGDDVADPFNAQAGPLPQIDEIDVFSQLGAPPDDDPLFGAAAVPHGKAHAPEPHIPPADPVVAEPHAESQHPSEPDDHDDDPRWVSHDDAGVDDPFDDLQIEDPHAANTDEPASAREPASEEQQPVEKARNGARRPAVMFDQPSPAPRRKRRWFFSVPLLFLMMLLTASAAATAIWMTVPVFGVVTGSLHFQHLKERPAAERNLFYSQQAALLADQSDTALDSTRERAKAKLRELYGNVSPGFLEDAQAYAMLVDRSRRSWIDGNGNAIHLRLETLNPQADSQRLHALLLALFEGNRRLIDQHNNARHNAEEVAANLRVTHEQITVLQARLEELKRDGERPVTPNEIAALQHEVTTLEKQWRSAEDAAHQAQAEIERMREAATRAVADVQDGSGSTPTIEDRELARMQEQFERLNQRLKVTAVADDLEINRTRQLMDAAITRLESQIEQVKNQMADVPELKGYVTIARILQDTTHQLTNELIHSQKQQLDTINAHKRKLDEQLAARRNEIWDNDPKLKELTALLDIHRRQYNAAIAADHPPAKDAMDQQAAAIARLEEQIADRRRALGSDLIYADAIKGMEELIRTSERRLAEDQKRAEERIATLQQQLAEAAPDLQKLPEEQKKIAAELERRLVEMNASRKAYSEAMARAADDNDAIRQTEAEALALKRQIESRRQELLTERLQALSEQQQAEIRAQIQAKADELTALEAAAREAYRVYHERFRHLAAVESGVTSAVASASKRDQVARELAAALTRRDELNARKQQVDQALAAVIVPIEPSPAEQYVQQSEIRDERPMYALISVGGIAFIFGILMLAAHHSHARAAVTQHVIEVEPPIFPSRDSIDPAAFASNSDRLEESPTA